MIIVDINSSNRLYLPALLSCLKGRKEVVAEAFIIQDIGVCSTKQFRKYRIPKKEDAVLHNDTT